MNKKLIVLLLTIVFLATCLVTLASCQNETEIDIEKAIVGIDITLKSVTDKNGLQQAESWIVKYFVDASQFDLSTANRLKFQTYIPKYDNHGNLETYGKVFTPTIPDDVAPTAENNYFVVEYDFDKYYPPVEREWSHEIADYIDNFYTDADGVKHYYPSEHLIVTSCYAYVYEEVGAEPGHNTIPSIGNTILVGLAMAVGGLIVYWIALTVLNRKIFVAIAFAIPIILTIGSYISWGWVRGLIMTAFFALYYIGVALVNKWLGEALE